MSNFVNNLIIPVFLILLTLLTSNVGFANALTQAGNQAKEEILTDLSKIPYEQYKNLTAGLHNGSILTIYNQSEAPPPLPPAVEICDGLDNDNNGQIDDGILCPPQPPICQSGTHVVNGTCVPDVPPVQVCQIGEFYNTTSQQCQPIPPAPACLPNQIFNQTTQKCDDLPPPTPLPSDRPALVVNISKTLRVGVIGDIDLNSGLDTQLAQAVKYHTQIFVLVGDYGYKDCQKVVDKIHQAGFDTNNAVIIQGNHDCSAITKAFNGDWTTLYGNTNFPDGVSSKLSVFAIDGNSAFDCSSAQYLAMKKKIDGSDAMYNIPAIHQPFVTVKSDHGPNGQFACWDALFRENGITLVLQAHNHNYQRIGVNGITYGVFGTGTHDTGGSMYPIGSNNWNGFDCQKCITGTNGITLLDFQIDDPHVRNMQGWFISNADKVMDKFN